MYDDKEGKPYVTRIIIILSAVEEYRQGRYVIVITCSSHRRARESLTAARRYWGGPVDLESTATPRQSRAKTVKENCI